MRWKSGKRGFLSDRTHLMMNISQGSGSGEDCQQSGMGAGAIVQNEDIHKHACVQRDFITGNPASSVYVCD